MASDLLQRARELVAAFEQGFSAERWKELCEELEQSDDKEVQRVVSDYVREHLEGRYQNERLPLYRWWKARKDGQNSTFDGMVTDWSHWLWEQGEMAGELRECPDLPKGSVVWCPPGRFRMGSPEEEEGRFGGEAQFNVELSRGFWMGQTPVTQAQFRHVMEGNVWGIEPSPSYFAHAGEDAPVEQVNWFMAAAYCNRLSELHGLPEEHWPYQIFVNKGGFPLQATLKKTWRKEGLLGCRGFRLPTEAEWEYACRAGTTTARYGELNEIAWWGAWEGNGNSQVNYEGGLELHNTRWGTHPVKQKAPNPWGFYDMLGNVAEFCGDWTGVYPSGDAFVCDPVGANEPTMRVVRGNNWSGFSHQVRAAYRFSSLAETSKMEVGFRVVKLGH